MTLQPKTLLRTAVLLLCGAALALPVMAQDAPPPPPAGQQGPPPGGPGRGGPGRRLEMLQHRLNLTPDQTTQVKAILDADRAKMDADQSGGDRRAKMMAMMEDKDAARRPFAPQLMDELHI